MSNGFENNKVREFVLRKCKEAGFTTEVDWSFYQGFMQLTEAELSAMIRFIFSSKSSDGKKNILKTSNVTDPYEHAVSCLNLVFEGMLQFSEDGYLLFTCPVGPPPTEEQEQHFEQYIASMRPLIERCYLEVLERNQSG